MQTFHQRKAPSPKAESWTNGSADRASESKNDVPGDCFIRHGDGTYTVKGRACNIGAWHIVLPKWQTVEGRQASTFTVEGDVSALVDGEECTVVGRLQTNAMGTIVLATADKGPK